MSKFKRIVLDFGHGGLDKNGKYTTDPKIGKLHKFPNGDIVYEGVINRWLGEAVVNELRKQLPNLECVMTVHYTDPTDLPLDKRVAKANNFNPEETFFVSIHCNAANTKARGFEIYTTKGQSISDVLGECIANEVEILYKQLGLTFRKDLSDGDKDKEANFYVLQKTRCAAVLLETLFFDNEEDYKILRNPIFQEKFATAVVKGIRTFIEK